ncbi:MAG: SRPBCC domain-containing protein [Spirochaetes bacterium]|nr:SRPBCC domain-containing protein [Spirochaetota bacterium]
MATINLSHSYPVAKEKVWEQLTRDELLTAWCLPSANFALEKGRQFKFEDKPSPFWDGVFINTVIDFDAGAFLSYRCTNARSKMDTIVTWKLTEKNGSTELSLEHSGFRPFKDLFTKMALTTGWKSMMEKKLHGKLLAEKQES